MSQSEPGAGASSGLWLKGAQASWTQADGRQTMVIEVWAVVALVALAAVGLVTLVKAGAGWVRRRREVNEAVAMMVQLSGQPESVVRAELRQLM